MYEDQFTGLGDIALGKTFKYVFTVFPLSFSPDFDRVFCASEVRVGKALGTTFAETFIEGIGLFAPTKAEEGSAMAVTFWPLGKVSVKLNPFSSSFPFKFL